jgi:hypothetical protein
MPKGRVVKVFSATKAREREGLGDKVTEFLAKESGLDVEEYHVMQSSDNEFHCLSIILWLRGQANTATGRRTRQGSAR